MIKTVANLKVGDEFKDVNDSDPARFAYVTGFGIGKNPVSKRPTRIIKMQCLGPLGVPYNTSMSLYPSTKVKVK